MLSPSFIFVIAKEIESSGRHVPSFPGGQECAEDGAIFSYILYGKRCHKMMSHFLFHGPVKSQPCLAEGPFGLLLPSLYGCFPSLPGPFLFPAHITTGPRSALPGTGLRLLLAPIRRHSTWQEVALLWASSTSGPAQAEQGHPTHGVSLPVCLCCCDEPQHPPSHPALPPWGPQGDGRICRETFTQLRSSTSVAATSGIMSLSRHTHAPGQFFMPTVEFPDIELGDKSCDRPWFSNDT